MAFGFMKPNGIPLAVDFGVSRLKVLQLGGSGDAATTTVQAAAMREVPEVLWDKPPERLEWQARALGEILRGGNFKGKRVMCAMPSVHTTTQHVQVPADAGKSTLDPVAEELRTLTGRDPSTLITRQYKVCEVSRSGAKRTETICFAMGRDAVLAHMRALKSCKLEPVGIHAEHIALVRALERMQAKDAPTTGATLIVDLGRASTKVAVFAGRDIALARTIGVGERHMSAVAPQPAPPPSADRGGVALAEAPPAPAACAELTLLSDEISQSVRYYQALFPDRKIDRLVFVGGGSTNTEVCRTIARVVRVPAQVADPIAALAKAPGFVADGLDTSAPMPGWAVAVGVSLLPTDL